MTIQRIPFAIASDESVSEGYTRQRLLNVYPETAQTRAKSPVLILGRPGLKPWASIGAPGVRETCVMDGVLYAVSGGTFSRVDSSGSETPIGSVTGSGFVVMATNGTQIAIATGKAWVAQMDGFTIWGRDVSGDAFLYNRLTDTFGQITDPDLFLTGTGKFQISSLNNASDYDALDFATAEKSPDAIVRGFVDRADLILFGASSTELWFNSGNADFPFERQQQAVIPKGIMGRECVAAIDNTAAWIGRDPEAGGPVAYRLRGYEAERISTHAVEQAFEAVTDWETVRCVSYVMKGHAFFHVIFADRPSWVYDCATRLWHEEETRGLDRWQGNSHSYVYGRHVIGSCNTAALFTPDPEYAYDGANTTIEAEMVSAPIGDDSAWKIMAAFQLDMETGVGLTTGQGSDPQVMMQYSDDRGKTWSSEKWRSAGATGEYNKRVRWGPLGRFRSRVLKVRMTDPVKRRFFDYFADIV